MECTSLLLNWKPKLRNGIQGVLKINQRQQESRRYIRYCIYSGPILGFLFNIAGKANACCNMHTIIWTRIVFLLPTARIKSTYLPCTCVSNKDWHVVDFGKILFQAYLFNEFSQAGKWLELGLPLFIQLKGEADKASCLLSRIRLFFKQEFLKGYTLLTQAPSSLK